MGGTFRSAAVVAVVVFTGALAPGCALDRAGVGGAPRDAGDLPASADARVARDASADVLELDGGACESRCDGDRAIRCSASGPLVDACDARGQLCVEDESGAHCVPPVCTPGSSRCEGDLLLTCDARGSAETSAPCAFGCETGSCVQGRACPFDLVLPEIVDEGEYVVDLCTRLDGARPLEGSCGAATGNGRDALVRLVLNAPRRLRIDLRDDDLRSIDTVLSLRSECDEASSQLQCADDVSCEEADVDLVPSCESGRQPRQSRIVRELAAGRYYVVIDSDARGAFECGLVRLRVRPIGGG